MSSTSSLVLITGATGHLGFRTLRDALKSGYRVRTAVRSEAKSQTVLNHPLIKALNLPAHQLSFVIVPDLAVEGAYDKAVQGVDYVIHIASPITTGKSDRTQAEYEKYFIEPAVSGALGMLKSAVREPRVKRIVITSSVVAIKTFLHFATGVNDKVTTAEDRIPFNPGPYTSEFEAYSASKTKSFNESEAWIAKNKPSYDVVFINPSFIEGRDDLVTTVDGVFGGTNGVILRAATGKQNPMPMPGNMVHNEDVARLHVEALNPKIPAGTYIASWNPEGTLRGSHLEDINDLVAKNFPEQVKSGVLPNNATQRSVENAFDSTKTEKTFGWKLQDFESQVKSVVGHYVELLNKA